MPEQQRPFCFPVMPVVWRVLLLWLCVSISLPHQVQGALVISKRNALTRDTKETVDDKSGKVDVFSVNVACTVTARFAHTVMTSKARNNADSAQEIFFEMELPKTAFITSFSMEIDGHVYVGEVKEKVKAKKQYEKAVSLGQSAGLVEASGAKMEKFSMSVNTAAKSNVTFVLIYEELLQRKLSQYEILTRIKTKQPVQEFQIVTDIYEPQGIRFVDATATFLSNELLPLLDKTLTDTKAHISFSPTVEQQRKCPQCEETIINGDFIIKYDVKREKSTGEVQTVNGYFVHFFSPPDLARVPKNVVFVIDRSGSMSGRKMVQTRDAMVSILNELPEDDHFTIIIFDDKIITWRDFLTKATEENVSDAVSFVRRINPDSDTNINRALLKAISMLKSEKAQKRVPEGSMDMIILLTDGMPNQGVSDTKRIQKNVRSATAGKMSLFCLGFGNKVDYSFLDVMSRENKGMARRIFEGSDATLQLKGFYKEVSSPLLLDVELSYPENTVELLTKNHYSQFFNGSEIVVAGRLNQNNMDNFLVEVSGQGTSEGVFERGKADVVNWRETYPETEYIFGDFTERLWAYLTIRQLLEKSDMSTSQEKDDAIAKALNMSLKYSFVTPLTSMVVTKPETEDGANSPLIADKLTEAQRQAADRQKAHQQAADRQKAGISRPPAVPRASSFGAVDGDPHFMIELPDKNDALCFNINDKPGTIFNLVQDQKSGFVVNGQIIGRTKRVPDDSSKTYFGCFGISHQKLGVRMEVNTHDISLFHNGKHVRLLWSDTAVLKDTDLDLQLTDNCSLTVTLRHSVKFMVIRHTKIWRKRHDQQDYLGFYTLDSHHLSASVHGLLGQYYHGVEFELDGVQGESEAVVYRKGQVLHVTRKWQKDFSKDVKNGENTACWFVDDGGRGLIDGTAWDYVVPDLFAV